MKIDKKFRNRLSDYLFKNNRLLFSSTITIVFPVVFGIFCNLIILKQGIEMQIFPKMVVEILKKWAPPRQVTFDIQVPPPVHILTGNGVVTKMLHIQGIPKKVSMKNFN